MKSSIKGIITGFLIAAVIFAVPAIAENIDALFNQVRINVNGPVPPLLSFCVFHPLSDHGLRPPGNMA